MNRILPLIGVALLSLGCGRPAPPPVLPKNPQRIVALSPNITETLFALGLGQKLVGDTTACLYPEAARAVPKIGGFGNINYEAIVALRPDLAIVQREREAETVRLQSLGIPCLGIGSATVADIFDTIRTIGSACGAETRADALAEELRRRMDAVAAKVSAAGSRPKVLVVFGRGHADDPVDQVCAIGPACLHGELLELAGGANVVTGRLPFATLSREAVLRFDPDVIIELAPDMKDATGAAKAWNALGSVKAVRNERVVVLNGDYVSSLGPRFVQILGDFETAIQQNDFVAE